MIDPATALELSPPEAAELAQLRYVSDQQPGWRRRRCGRGFSYLNQAGERLGQAQTARLRALAIPPAWTEVWICPWPNGHIQAVGRDARGRKQYLYHPRWQQLSDETKFSRILAFGEQLPELRARIEHDLGRRGVSRERILAAVVRLLETTLIRIGNREYARRDQSFGLTTLRDDHLDVRGSTLRFQFRGKSGKEHEVTLADRRLARLVKQCQELPGQELFQYLGDDGAYHALESVDVNAYLREVTGSPFTAKDFRTWGGTVAAASQL
ncbi:MAG: DNA topoisomerase IB, partial [Armatimonadetes bacterium]|nr:DNA topoisomerase IB [Armatimonadota bacterium]